MIGFLHWRCQEDEKLLKALSEASVLPVESTNQVREERTGGREKEKMGREREKVSGCVQERQTKRNTHEEAERERERKERERERERERIEKIVRRNDSRLEEHQGVLCM